ncbi:MAG: AAA family ATPase [Candidatus Latescibacteria bacterium]|nr:AAA family ATPase [Candidatus Latescibacterota bacterium]
MPIYRSAQNTLLEALGQFPAVALVGPRQCGKTTLVHMLNEMPAPRFYDLEDPRHRLILEDPLQALQAEQGQLVVIDEAQRMPELFPVLRVLIDRDRRPGQFLLLGSAMPDLRRQSAESLAGRLMTIELTPFTAREAVPQYCSQDTLWERGGFPLSLLAATSEQSALWRQQYVRDITERDLRQLGFDLPPARMYRFLQMLAHNHGQLWNASQLARSLEVGATTAGRYLDIIQQTYLLRRLQPYLQNMGKRLTKSPKVYIRDTGILHVLLALQDREQILGHPVSGYSWEGFAIEQFAAVLPPAWDMAFWRTASGAEIDLLLLRGGRPVIAVEMKTNTTDPRPSRGFYEGCKDLDPEEKWVVYPGEEAMSLARGVEVLPLTEAVERFMGASSTGQ